MDSNLFQLFVVQRSEDIRDNAKVIVWALSREDAKRKASLWIQGDRERFVVTPITNPGDRVKLDITLNV